MAKFIIYSLSDKISYAQIFEVDKPEEAVIKAKEIAKSIAKNIDFDYDKIEVDHRNLGFQIKQHDEFSISMRDTIGNMSLILQVVPDPRIADAMIANAIKSAQSAYDGISTPDTVAADIANLEVYADKVWNMLIDKFCLTRDERYNLQNSLKLKNVLEWSFV